MNDQLSEYSDTKRLSVYKMLTAACGHMYSKGKLQEEKFLAAANIFAELAKKDPLFLAHFVVWSSNQDSKDQKVLSVFFNALSDADGLPFFAGSEMNKPNLRVVSHSVMQNMDVPTVLRVVELANKRFGVKGLLNESCHFPTSLKTSLRKYLLYREAHTDMLKGIRNAGLTQKYTNLYRIAGLSPSDYAVGLFKWNQKDGRKWEEFQKQEEALPDFKNLTSRDIVEVLGKVKLSPIIALSIIPHAKITSAVASQLVKNCTGNQAIVLYNWFASNGFLDVKSIRDLFEKKVQTATTAVDRIDTLTRNAVAEDKEMMSNIRSANRKAKANTASFGKIFMHIDISGSMNDIIQYAKDNASVFAECVENPEKNFAWGTFNHAGHRLPIPASFKKEGFYSAMYGICAGGSTDCYANYEEARKFGANVDVFVTDEGHNCRSMAERIQEYHARHPSVQKPSAVVIVKFGRGSNLVEQAYKANGIPVVIMAPESLKESAMVSQSVAIAMKGEMSVIEDIMSTKLVSLPSWWNSVEKVNYNKQSAKVSNVL